MAPTRINRVGRANRPRAAAALVNTLPQTVVRHGNQQFATVTPLAVRPPSPPPPTIVNQPPPARSSRRVRHAPPTQIPLPGLDRRQPRHGVRLDRLRRDQRSLHGRDPLSDPIISKEIQSRQLSRRLHGFSEEEVLAYMIREARTEGHEQTKRLAADLERVLRDEPGWQEFKDLKKELRETYAKIKALTQPAEQNAKTLQELIAKRDLARQECLEAKAAAAAEDAARDANISEILKLNDSSLRVKEYRRRLRYPRTPQNDDGNEKSHRRRIIDAAEIVLTAEEEIQVKAKEEARSARIHRLRQEFKERQEAEEAARPRIQTSPRGQSNISLRSQGSSEREAHDGSSPSSS